MAILWRPEQILFSSIEEYTGLSVFIQQAPRIWASSVNEHAVAAFDIRVPYDHMSLQKSESTFTLLRPSNVLQAAKELCIRVVGISFHVGSAATNPVAFEEAIAMADHCFAVGKELGFKMTLLDIGGGFSSSCFDLEGQASIPAAVNRALDLHFPAERGVQIISEPGRCAIA